MMHVCLYEDQRYVDLMPLTFLRPAYELLLGGSTLAEKVASFFGHSPLTLFGRDALRPVLRNRHRHCQINTLNTGAPVLFINGRTWLTTDLTQRILDQDPTQPFLLTQRDQVVALYLTGGEVSKMADMLRELPSDAQLIRAFRNTCVTREINEGRLMSSLWDLVIFNPLAMREDAIASGKLGVIKGDLRPFVALENESDIFVDSRSVVEDFVLLNATNGPIFIASDVIIEAHTRIEGPACIGRGARIMGGKITASAVGPHCKVAGEVSHSVFLSHSNKAHTGFIGHSYIGQWCNLGAMTTTSNLKNTYGQIRLQTPAGTVETGQRFLGAVLGDHVKLGIGTLLGAGTVIGYGSALTGPDIHDKWIPPFSWGTAGDYTRHELHLFLKTAQAAMQRRGIELHQDEAQVIMQSYDLPES